MKTWIDLVTLRNGEYAIAWHDEEDGEGARLGGSGETLEQLETELARAKEQREREQYEWTYVEIETLKNALKLGGHLVPWDGWRFPTGYAAKRGLGIARAARKAAKFAFDEGREMPEWAKQALAAGWKAPKGWKP